MAAPLRSRRRFTTALALTPFLGVRRLLAASGGGTILAAAWDDGASRHFIGRVQADAVPGVRVLDALEVPTRAHGLACMPDGSVIAVARRPGDWLLRWKPGTTPRWHWIDDTRRFSGHVSVSADAGSILTTEVEIESGHGMLAHRDAASLELLDVWPTHGRDPHDIERLPDGSVLVANGGIETLAETGRTRHNLAQMDSSVVRIDIRSGARISQWRLDDPRLSIRHLARLDTSTIGIGLQAEHDAADSRAAAPVFATLDLERCALVAYPAVRVPAGYSGDIAAVAGGWLLSCPKDDRLLRVRRDGGDPAVLRLAEGCAIAADPRGTWALGSGDSLLVTDTSADRMRTPALRFDNHAVHWPG